MGTVLKKYSVIGRTTAKSKTYIESHVDDFCKDLFAANQADEKILKGLQVAEKSLKNEVVALKKKNDEEGYDPAEMFQFQKWKYEKGCAEI